MTLATATAPTAGRGWARFGFGVGVTASVAANVAHSYVPPPDVAGDASWSPAAGAIVAAAFWPLALVISVEVIQRVQWPSGWVWRATRWGGMTAVAGIAAVISYRHLSGLMGAYGEDGLSSTIGPLAVDGMMVVCSAALLAIGDNARRQHRAPSATRATTRASSANDTPAAGSDTVAAPVALPRHPVRVTRAATRDNDLTRQNDTRRRGVDMARSGAAADAIAAELDVSLRTAQRYAAAARRQTA